MIHVTSHIVHFGKHLAKIKELSEAIAKLDCQYAASPIPEIYQYLVSKRNLIWSRQHTLNSSTSGHAT